ncbi:MAG: HAMP domain-containing histidine kinase [Bacteroidales bacterium]|nr:HAMP domain-containing histidine kinase [Bacteroidales bacterium]
MEEKTQFAPSLTNSIEVVLNDHDIVASQKLFTEIFGAIAGISAVINKNRQIVYANNAFLDFLGIKSLELVLGKKTGQTISCIHAGEKLSGCGTSEACQHCGAVNAVLVSQETKHRTIRETSISSLIDGLQKSWDLKVTSTPIVLANREFYVLSIQDISYEKRLMALERIFFHDLLNIASGLNGLLTLMKEGIDPEDNREIINKSVEASQDMIEEIMLYRQLRAAENGDIQVKIEGINSVDFLKSVTSHISSHEVGQNKTVRIDEKSYVTSCMTDRILLQRIVINMLKNALEATANGGTVLTGFDDMGDRIRVWVHNSGVIPPDIQLQIFNRSFSTKGMGRGIGTYSIRLLAENYLRGKAGLISNESQGTIFYVDLNKEWTSDL